MCELKKNEAFMTSENLWIAAESFKISLSPNPDGLIYTEVPPSYYIRVEIDDAKEEKTHDVVLDCLEITSAEGLTDVKSIYIQATPFLSTGVVNGLAAPSVDYRSIVRGVTLQANDFCITKGSKIHLELSDGAVPPVFQPMDVILSQNPMDFWSGAGYGKNGLEAIQCFTPAFGAGPWPPLDTRE